MFWSKFFSNLYYFYAHTEIQFNSTTCSKDAFMRGAGQKVVGFSFYGDINTPKNKKKGNSININEMDQLYTKYDIDNNKFSLLNKFQVISKELLEI